jgi:AcrR family transcriptional regulator
MAGLRERKKAQTRTQIQRQALRLFREQGFHVTTVEQIAEAADVSPSTVFRYFPTKEDLAVLDDQLALADAITHAFAAQPPGLSAIQALRAALRSAFTSLPPADRAARLQRDMALVQVPELWAANLRLVARGVETLAELVARRTGREPQDPAVRTFTGAVLGVSVRVLLDAANDPDSDPEGALDEALGLLEAGLRL